MRTPPLLADFSHARACKPFCENSLTLPDGMGRFLFLPDAMWGAESPLYSLINLLTQGRIRFLIAKQFIPVRFILLLKRQELVG